MSFQAWPNGDGLFLSLTGGPTSTGVAGRMGRLPRRRAAVRGGRHAPEKVLHLVPFRKMRNKPMHLGHLP